MDPDKGQVYNTDGNVTRSHSKISTTRSQELLVMGDMMHAKAHSPSPLTVLPNAIVDAENIAELEQNTDKVNNDTNDTSNQNVDKEKTDSFMDKHTNDNIPHRYTDKYIPKPIKNQDKKLRLNPSTIYPTTVPPFVLEEIYNKTFERDLQEKDILYDFNKKTFSETNSTSKWIDVINNLGSNVEYLENQKSRITYIEKNAIQQNNQLPKTINFRSPFNENDCIDSVSVRSFFPVIQKGPINSSKFGNNVEYDNDDFANDEHKTRKIIFSDLESPWKGDERLNEIFEFNNTNHKFNKDKDIERQWNAYLPRLLNRVYHSKLKLGENPLLTDNLDKEEIFDNNGKRKTKTKPPPGSFEAETERWKKYYNKKVQGLTPKLNDLIDNNRYLPLTLRIIIFIMALISLGLSVRIFQNSRVQALINDRTVPIQSSVIMSIVVNTLAVTYTIYIAWNEFNGKPIGLRDSTSKMMMILMDLLFIIFTSATLALAFNSRFDDYWVCNRAEQDDQLGFSFPYIAYICRKQDALVSFMFIMVFFWVSTLIIMILKIVRRSAKV